MPPEMTLVILKAGGEVTESRATSRGAAAVTAARAKAVKVYFILEQQERVLSSESESLKE